GGAVFENGGFLPRGRVPDPDRAVGRARREPLAVTANGQSEDQVGMTFEYAELLPLTDDPHFRRDFPDSDRSIIPRRGEPGISRAETGLQYPTTMSLQHCDVRPAFDVPNMDGVIASARRRDQVAA